MAGEEQQFDGQWTDRPLLQFGVLSAIEVEEQGGGSSIQRLRARCPYSHPSLLSRYGPEKWSPWRETGYQFLNPQLPRQLQLGSRGQISGYSGDVKGELRSLSIKNLEGEEEVAGTEKPTLRTFSTSRWSFRTSPPPTESLALTHLSGDQSFEKWSVRFHYE